MAASVHDFLRFVVEQKASDLHLKAGGPPAIRINGKLTKSEFPAMTSADCEKAVMELMDDEQARKFKDKGKYTIICTLHSDMTMKLKVK